MSAEVESDATMRPPLTRERILRAAVALADRSGVESLSMRKLAQELDVVPMALYRHVANKDEMLGGMIDVVVGEIDPPDTALDWKTAMRRRILSARQAMLRHRWTSRVLETRTAPTPAVIAYMDEMIGMFRRGGFSIDLTHHALHAMGSRMLGFSQELYDDSADSDPEAADEVYRAMADRYPNIGELLGSVLHDQESVIGGGCDDQFEFEFALDLMLDGLDRLRDGG
jgi:AcrR family transcriptional regulator